MTYDLTQQQPKSKPEAPAQAHPHNPLADDPPVAAVESGGPDLGPGLLVQPKKFQYEALPGFFMQTGPDHKSHDFEYMLERSFGMIDTSPDRWHNFKRDIARLQADAPAGVQYKVFFLGRHGEGWHNYSVSKIGVEAWEDYWAMQYSHPDLGLTWGPDPELTKLGVAQAEAVQKCWRTQAPLGAPISKEEMKWYVSPLTRTAQTMLHSWGDMLADTPEVWEDWREVYGSHTCDKRRSRTYIAERFPSFKLDDTVTEEDELWKEDIRETDQMMQVRGQRALDRVFSKGGAEETYISVTAHSGNLRNLLAVLGHQPYPLSTGEMIPVVVKATAVAAHANGVNGINGTNGANGHA